MHSTVKEVERKKNCIIIRAVSNYRLDHSKRDLTDIDTHGKIRARGRC